MGTTSDSNTHTGHRYSDLDADPDTHNHVGCDAGTYNHAYADLISMSGLNHEENDVVRCSVGTH